MWPTVDFEKLLRKSQDLPWRSIIWALSISFFIASLTANVVSILMMPNLDVAKQGPTSIGEYAVVSGIEKPILSEADLKIIYDRNLFNHDGVFGDLDPTGKDAEGGGTEVIKTDLPLRLLGVIYGGTPFNGLATVENTQNSKINSFVVGDTLMSNAVVDEIHRTRVYIMRNGSRKEYLELDAKEIVRDSRKKSRIAKDSSSSGATPIATGPALKTFKEEGFERVNGEMTMSQDYKQRILTQDFAKVLQDAKAVPNTVDGQIKGFRLERIREGSIWQKAGFQNGDVVEEINGVPLSDPGNAIRLLQGLRNEPEIDVMVNRGTGAPVPMKLQVR